MPVSGPLLLASSAFAGNGTFTDAPDVAVGNGPTRIAAGDFNRDGHVDIATVNFLDDDISVRLGRGDGTFASAPDVAGVDDELDIAAADFDADGKDDLAVASQTDDLLGIRLGVGDGTFTSAADVGIGDLPREIAFGDFNTDGDVDIAVAASSDDAVSIRLGLPGQAPPPRRTSPLERAQTGWRSATSTRTVSRISPRPTTTTTPSVSASAREAGRSEEPPPCRWEPFP